MSQWIRGQLLLGLLVVAVPAAGQETCRTNWQLDESLRIGSLDGPDALSAVRSLAVSPEGELYVTQYQVGHVTGFSPEGELVRTIGRSGQGPGEFELAPTDVGWVGGRLWIADQFRSQSFDLEGDPVDFVRFWVSAPEESARYTPGLPLADGTFWGHRWLSPNLGPEPYGPETEQIAVRRFSRSGEELGTMAQIDIRDRFVRYSDRPAYTEHPMWELLPGSFHGELEQNVLADRSAIVLLGEIEEAAGSSSFTVLRIGLEGDTLAQFSVPYEPVPVSSEHQAWLRERFAASMAGDYSEESLGAPMRSEEYRNRMREEVSENFWTPRFHPPVREIIAGQEGSVWILRELLEPGGSDRWEVYDWEGDLVGRISISTGRSDNRPWGLRVRILRASRERVWGTTVDEYGVSYLHRFDVVDACR